MHLFVYAHFLICFVLCDAQSKYHCVRPLAELEIAHSDTPEDGVLVFTHDEHEVEEPDDNQEPTKQWGIHLFYQARANFYLIRNEGNPVFSLNELILEYINVPNKPAFPTPEQMRSRAQHLSLSRTTDANFQTNADVNGRVQQRLLPATVEEWRQMDPHKVFVLAHGHDPTKGQVIVLSTKALFENNVRQEVN